MPLTDPPDTLSHHMSRPLTTRRDMSDVPMANVVAKLQQYQTSANPHPNPESEALAFYGLNHGMALIGQQYATLQPLDAEALDFVNHYHSRLSEKAVRAFYYLLIITTREARHCKSWSTDKGKFGAKFGSTMADFLTSGSGEHGIHQNMVNNPPAVSVGTFTRAVRWIFYNCKWPASYGGPAWGKVSDCLVNFVDGTFSAEMMLDTIWTLCHNNGPIFNKGHLYGQHTHNLIRILDVQRSGQIPQLCADNASIKQHLPLYLGDRMSWLRARYKLPAYVDWYVVEALGAVHTYASEKKAQIKNYGLSEEASAVEQAAAKKEAKAKAAAAKAAAEYAEKNWDVYPGLTVKKIKRAA